MSEDTRKDKRAKIVSLNVRYKSATVDEFIENHSHDVSKGGLFIKTPTPFPPGTLIKFEIRIANDRAVIMGVGRVVWKREPSQAAGERPSGMGVKFIKIDDSSRQLIDRIVAEKEGAGGAYAADQEAGEGTVKAATRPISDRPNVEPAKPGSLRPGEIRKETIIGIGASSPPPKSVTTAGGGMFPSSTSAPEEGPVKEKTVMKQAAELLEEALKEAGGSMDEVGNNPLFDAQKAAGGHHAQHNDDLPAVKSTLVGMPATVSSRPPSASPSTHPSAQPPSVRPPSARPAPVQPSSAPPPRAKSEPPRVEPAAAKRASEAPPANKRVSAPPPSDDAPTSRQRRTDPPALRAKAAAAEPEKSGGMIWVFVLAIVAGSVAFVYKDNILGTEPPAPSATPTTASPPPAPMPAPTPTPVMTATAAPTPTVSAAPTPAPPPSPAVTAVAPPPTPAVVAPAPTPKPTPAPPPVVAAPHPTPAPAPTPKPAPAPKPAVAAEATPAPAPAPAPKKKPKGDDTKPAAGADDNPY